MSLQQAKSLRGGVGVPIYEENGPRGWSVSISIHKLLPVLTQVKGDVMKVGRDHSCDLWMTEAVFTGSTDEDLQLGKVSRVQFQLLREGATTVLDNKSMNGTYVNGMKLGKGRRFCLDQENIISI